MKLFVTPKAQKELDKIPTALARTIITKIQNLGIIPYPPYSKKLQGQDNYHLRIGSYRVIYWVDTSTREITILRVADRKTVYI